MVLNCDLIEHIEATPDTVITLTTGQKITCIETAEDIIQRVRIWRHSLLTKDPPCEDNGSCIAGRPAAFIPKVKTNGRAQNPEKQNSFRPDFATIGGLILALGGIAAALIMEGGKIQDIAQITSALIVLGGTMGAVMITTPLPVLIRAAKQFSSVIFGKVQATNDIIEEIIGYAAQARKNGIVSLEQDAESIRERF